jgi:hypothetical protein
MKRREFITLPAKCLGGLLVYTLRVQREVLPSQLIANSDSYTSQVAMTTSGY